MTALELKYKLQALDHKIVRLLSKGKYKGITGSGLKLNIETNGSAATILHSINSYDQTALTQLAISPSAHINDKVLKTYVKAKKKLEIRLRTQLHRARVMKAKIKNAR